MNEKERELKEIEREVQRRNRRRMALLLSLVVVGFAILVFFFFQVQPVMNSEEKTNSGSASFSRSRARKAELQQYVADMQLIDDQLRAKWKNIKEGRRTDQQPGHARRHYEQRLAEMEADYEKFRDSAGKKNSIGWEMKREIKSMKTDAPPLN